MRNQFEEWMSQKYKRQTVASYSYAINEISQHYSNESGKNIDIYQIKNEIELQNICKAYNKGGRFEEFGDDNGAGNDVSGFKGLYRAAINAYVCFIKETADRYVEKPNKEYKINTEGEIAVKNSTGDIIINIRLPGILKEL